MHTLLFLLFATPLGVINWIDLSGLVTTIALVVYVYRFGRTTLTREDMDTAIEDMDAALNIKASDLEDKISKVDERCKERTKELKEDFIKKIEDLKSDFTKMANKTDRQFEILLENVISVIKEKKDK